MPIPGVSTAAMAAVGNRKTHGRPFCAPAAVGSLHPCFGIRTTLSQAERANLVPEVAGSSPVAPGRKIKNFFRFPSCNFLAGRVAASFSPFCSRVLSSRFDPRLESGVVDLSHASRLYVANGRFDFAILADTSVGAACAANSSTVPERRRSWQSGHALDHEIQEPLAQWVAMCDVRYGRSTILPLVCRCSRMR